MGLHINRAMPWNQPKSLTTDDVYAVVAYILNMGGVVPSDYVLSDKKYQATQNRACPTATARRASTACGSRAPNPDAGLCLHDQLRATVTVTSHLPDYAHATPMATLRCRIALGGVRGAEKTGAGATNLRGARCPQQGAPLPAGGGVRPDEDGAGPRLPACHGIGNKIVGPWHCLMCTRNTPRNGDRDAIRLLTVRIKIWRFRAWEAPRCQPQDHVPDAEIHAIAEWIAAGCSREPSPIYRYTDKHAKAPASGA